MALVLGVPSALGTGQDLSDRKGDIDSRIASLRSEVERAKEREHVLTADVESVTAEIRAIQGDVDALSAKVAKLEAVLAAHQAELERLRELYETQTRHLGILTRDNEIARSQLEERLVELYKTDVPDDVSILFQVRSLSELIEQIEYVNEIGRRDREIAAEVKRLKREMQAARRQTAAIKQDEARTTAELAERTAEERAARDELAVHLAGLEEARQSKEELLGAVRADQAQAQEDIEALERESAELAARIQSAQSTAASQSAGGAPSAAGLVWPVDGALTSPFGWRWGRLHAGIDVGASEGTPIRAAAAGTVIYAGWLGGYGNLVVIDHGGGLATAYAHQSAIYVTAGSVAQGAVIGAVGNTGHSFGPHLHFEVRINGFPVDPLGYL